MKRRKGLTLIEIIISIALLGMVAVVFLTIFNSGNKNILSSGDRTKNALEIQKKIDTQINNSDDLQLDGIKVEKNEDIEIKIEGISPQTIKGKIITGNQNGINIITFVPYKSKGE